MVCITGDRRLVQGQRTAQGVPSGQNVFDGLLDLAWRGIQQAALREGTA